MQLSILYRGPLVSCNYACGYCPFAKRHETAAELAVDRRALERFVEWVRTRSNDQLGVLFTPWGEALTRPWYHWAITELSRLPQIERVAVQTNLSCGLDWLAECDRSRTALWCTYHPGEVSRSEFLGQCRQLDTLGVRYSVGVVGLKEHLAETQSLRRELSADTYLWINAYKDQPDYYTNDDVQAFAEIDPLFAINNTRHPSLGQACRAGEQVISVDGDGTIRRCHFIREPIGNLYEPNFERCLQPRPCSNATCGCHIGYVHLDRLKLYDVFGADVLARIPAVPWRTLSPA